MATVTQAGQAGEAALVVKGDGRVHSGTPLADWCNVDGVVMTTRNLHALCIRKHATPDIMDLYWHLRWSVEKLE